MARFKVLVSVGGGAFRPYSFATGAAAGLWLDQNFDGLTRTGERELQSSCGAVVRCRDVPALGDFPAGEFRPPPREEALAAARPAVATLTEKKPPRKKPGKTKLCRRCARIGRPACPVCRAAAFN